MEREKLFYGWVMVGVLWIIYFINFAFPYYGAGVINAHMAKAIGLERSTLGLGFMIVALIGGGTGPLIALLLNKKGVRFTIVAGSLVTVVGALLMALWVRSSWQYVLIFGIVIGLGIGFSSALPVQTGITLWFTRKRALALAITLTSSGIGGFVAAPLLNRLIMLAGDNWQAGWFFVAGTCAVSALVAFLFIKNRPSDLGQVPDGIRDTSSPGATNDQPLPVSNRVYRTSRDWEVKDAFRTSALWLIVAGSAAFMLPVMIFVAHGVVHLVDLGHSSSIAAMSLGLLTLSSVIGRLLSGFLGDRFEPRYLWSAALLSAAVGILVVIQAHNALHIYLYAIFLGVGYGMSYVCWITMVGNYFGANSFASIMGIQGAIVTLFGALGPFFTGLAYDLQGNYTMAFLITAGLCIIGSILIFFAKPPGHEVKP